MGLGLIFLKVHARALTSPRVQGFVLSQLGQARRGSIGLSRRDPGTTIPAEHVREEPSQSQ